MKTLQIITLLFITTLFVACGNNTNEPIQAYASAISIDQNDTSIYSTDTSIQLSATASFIDGTTKSITKNVNWESDFNGTYMQYGEVWSSANNGVSTIKISYKNFSDSIKVSVKELLSINYTDINTSDTSNAQVIYLSGNFENNETNITMQQNITWSSDANATITESNTTQITLTIHSLPAVIAGALFSGSLNQVTFTHTIE